MPRNDETKPRKPPASTTAGAVELTHRQLAAARTMAMGKSVGAVAEAIGVNPRTLLRWRRMPSFAAEVRRLHDRMAVATAVGTRTTGGASGDRGTSMTEPRSAAIPRSTAMARAAVRNSVPGWTPAVRREVNAFLRQVDDWMPQKKKES